MTMIAVGDLAQSVLLRSHQSALKRQMTSLAEELTTGRSADPGRRLSGNLAPLAAIEDSLAKLGAYRIATAEAAMRSDAMQISLGQLDDGAAALLDGLLLAGSSGENALISAAGNDAHAQLEQAISALKASVAGQSLFSGAATDQPALAPADQIMAALGTAVAGQTTASGVAAAVEAWFDTPGGGFETLAYTGAVAPSGPVRLSDGQSIALDVTAADPAVRDMLRGLATAALLADDALLGGDVTERAELARTAGEQLVTAAAPLAQLRAEVGSAQSRIETIQAENATKTSMLELARGELVGVDPYDAATALEAVQGQLETLYTITARMARLSLADYLS